MKHFMIKYQFANGTTEAWHQEIEKFISVNIGNHNAAALLGHQRVGAGVRR